MVLWTSIETEVHCQIHVNVWWPICNWKQEHSSKYCPMKCMGFWQVCKLCQSLRNFVRRQKTSCLQCEKTNHECAVLRILCSSAWRWWHLSFKRGDSENMLIWLVCSLQRSINAWVNRKWKKSHSEEDQHSKCVENDELIWCGWINVDRLHT